MDDETASSLESLNDLAKRLDDVDVEELRCRVLHDFGLLGDVGGAFDTVWRNDTLLNRGRPEEGDELGGFETCEVVSSVLSSRGGAGERRERTFELALSQLADAETESSKRRHVLLVARVEIVLLFLLQVDERVSKGREEREGE